MHSSNFIYTSPSECEEWLKEQAQHTNTATSILVQIFDGTLDQARALAISKLIKDKLANATVIATSTCGEIMQGAIYEQNTIISLSSFEQTKLQIFSSEEEPTIAGRKMAQALVSKETKCIILFIDGLAYDSHLLLEHFNEAGGDKVIVSGGISGDNFLFDGSSYLLADTKTITNGLVAVALDNQDLHCFNDYNFGWKSVGKEMLITKAKGHRVYEIDHIPAAEIYAKYLGEELVQNPPVSMLEFPLTYKKDNIQVAMYVLKLNPDQSLEFSADINEGEMVQFGIEDEASVINRVADVYVKASIQPIESIFIYSCAARKTFFKHHLEDEFKALSHVATQTGFITYGEFSHIHQKNNLFSATSVILGLSESNALPKHLKTDILPLKHLHQNSPATSKLLKVTSQELNEQLQLNKNLLNLLEQHQAALDKASLVSKTDPRGFITYSNTKFCELSGYSQEELIGQPHSIVRHPETPSFVFKEMWETLQSKKVWSGMLQNRKKDGSSYYVHATIFPILDANGTILEFMALREDLTSRIFYEKSLEEQSSRLYKILDNQESIVALTTEEGRVSFLNQTFFDTFNFINLDDFLSKYHCLCELYVGMDGKPTGCKVDCSWEIVGSQTSTIKEKACLIDKNGKVLTFNITTKKISLDKDAVFISTLTDITEIENARLKAEETQRIKEDFLANMSHEIRTPLNGILGFSDLLNESRLSDDQQQYVNVLQHSANLLLGVVNDILDFSKLEQGKMQESINCINFFNEMHLIYMNYLPKATQKCIHYHLNLDAKIDEFLCIDELHLKQVLSNLINNALKFTPTDKSITINATLLEENAQTQTLEFSVKDTGIGISKKRQATIFEPFIQEDTSTTRKYGGTGLGLSISSSLVKLMGGEIELKSEKNKGSEFSFTLCLQKSKTKEKSLKHLLTNKSICIASHHYQTHQVSAFLKGFNLQCHTLSYEQMDTSEHDIFILFNKEAAQNVYKRINQEKHLVIVIDSKVDLDAFNTNPHIINTYTRNPVQLYIDLRQYAKKHEEHFVDKNSFNGARLRVLVAEDNEVNQMLIMELMKKHNIQTDLVDNGQRAVEQAKNHSYDLILMDINMPVLNGLEATKQIIQTSQENKSTPIVALTSNVLEKDISRFKAAGMYAHIAKPINASELKTLLSKLFDNKDNDAFIQLSFNEIRTDLQEAQDLLELSSDIMTNLFDKFLVSAQNIIQEMHKAQEDKEFQVLYELAHKLKGASSSLCLHKLTSVAVSIDKAIEHQEKDSFYHEIQQLEHFLDNLHAYKEQK